MRKAQTLGIPWQGYLELTKPRVVLLIVFTAWVGMLLATPGLPGWQPLLFGTLGIGLSAACGAVVNHILDQDADARMARTERRPLPQGVIDPVQAGAFALALGSAGMLILAGLVNLTTAGLTFLALIGYAVVYTRYLKRATPQNIVIGGAAGAAPPVLGWTAVTGEVHPHALLLFLIIFAWTPPHFWALAIHRAQDYARAGIPMLPVTHGIGYTRVQILLYTLLLLAVSLLPFATRMSGLPYLVAALALGGVFLYYAIALCWSRDERLPMTTFGYSIVYLLGIFTALLVDHYLPRGLPG